jgi:alpha-1,2-mannosyltransferase
MPSTKPLLPSEAPLLSQLRSGAWLDRERLFGYTAILGALELLTFLFMIAGTHGLVVRIDHPTTTDFVSFYGAGMLANDGTPALAYDHAAHYAAEQQAREPGIGYQYFYYPPVYLLLCSALARLPYIASFIVFETATLALFIAVAFAILGEWRWRMLVPLLAFPCVFWNFGLGQNAFLTAALFGAATLFVDRRPGLAGMLFGALCYKPHVALLVPVALAASRRWRAFAAAAATAAALIALSVACFGWDTWRAFFATFAHSNATYDSGRIDFNGFATPFGAIRLLGGSPVLAYLAQGLATLAAATLVAIVWRRGPSLPIRAAALAAGSLVAAPVLLIYDGMLAAVAGLWLARDWRRAIPWEKTAIAALFVVPLFARNAASFLHAPVLPSAAIALFVLAALRAGHAGSEKTANLPGESCFDGDPSDRMPRDSSTADSAVEAFVRVPPLSSHSARIRSSL